VTEPDSLVDRWGDEAPSSRVELLAPHRFVVDLFRRARGDDIICDVEGCKMGAWLAITPDTCHIFIVNTWTSRLIIPMKRPGET